MFKDHAHDKATELRWGNLRGGCRDSQTVSHHQDHVGRYVFPTKTTYLRVYIRLFGKAFDLWHLLPTDLGMDDDGDDDPVPLPNVNAAILKKVRRTPKPGLLLHGSSLTIHLLQLCPAHPNPYR